MKKWMFPGALLSIVLMGTPAFAQVDPGYGPAPSASTAPAETASRGGQWQQPRGRGGGDVDVVLHVDLGQLLGTPQYQRGGYQRQGSMPMQVMPTWQPQPQYGYANQLGGYYVPQSGWSGPLPQNEPPKCYNRYGLHYCATQFMQ